MKIFSIILILFYFTKSFSTIYYVNDNALTGDIYCSAIGNIANNGTTTATPKALISQVLSSFVLTAGDIIYVDAGTYNDYINPGTNDNGTASGYVKIIGAGTSKTIIGYSTAAANTFYFNASKYIWIEGMRINAETNTNLKTPFYIYGDADYNIINKCLINGPSTTSGWASGSVSTHNGIGIEGSATTTNPDFNRIVSCTITATKYGIHFKGFSGTPAQMADGNLFVGNTVQISTPSAGTTEFTNLIYFTKNTEVSRNKFQNFFTGLCFSNSTGTTTDDNINAIIANNYFTDNVNSDVHCGIHIKTTKTNTANIKIYNNSFYFNGGTYGCLHSEHASGPLGLTIKNNLFSVAANGTSSSIYTFDSNTGTNKFDAIDYNYYDCPLIDYIAYGFGGSTYALLTNWKAVDHDAGGTSGDVNSKDNLTTVGFVGATSGNLDLSGASSIYTACPAYNGLGIDINSNVRPTTPGATPHSFGAYDKGTVFLPISLLHFSGHKTPYGNELSWTTVTEQNNDYFTVEKSYDGITFFEIGTVKGAGNSTELINYQITDSNPFEGTNYYRLKQTDFNGSYKHHAIIYIDENESANKPFIFPNPIQNELHIKNITTTNISITVINASGLKIDTELLPILLDETSAIINVSKLEQGVYVLKLQNNQKSSHYKFIKE